MSRFFTNPFDGLFNLDDKCLDEVDPAAAWAGEHPEEIGRGLITAATSPFGFGAAARAENALEAARTVNDWVGGLGDMPDVNREIGAWAGPPLAGLGAWGACHVENAIDAWGTTPAPSEIVPVTSPAGPHDWTVWATVTGDGFAGAGPTQGSAFDPPSSTWALPYPAMEPSFVEMGAPSDMGTGLAFDSGQAPGWTTPATAADWHGGYLAGPSDGVCHVAAESSSSGSASDGGSGGSGGI
jgi:hypothetical protein